MKRHIHVLQGDSAAGSFSQAMEAQPGEVVSHLDVLSSGPLPPYLSLEQWTGVRQAYWDSLGPPGEAPEVPGLFEFPGGALEESVLRDAATIVVWVGVGVAEQLLLAWLVQRLALMESRAEIGVVQFTHFGRWKGDAWGLGLLNPEQLKNHPPIEELSAEMNSGLRRYWEAVTSSDPAGLLGVLSDDAPGLQHFRSAVRTMLRRYPDRRTGLGRWDYELLKHIRLRGPSVLRVIGWTMGEEIDPDIMGDFDLFARLKRMAAPDLPRPLVRMSGNPDRMRECELSLTEAGEAVLDGRANAVEMNGIDDWVMGVHLSSAQGKVWRHQDGALVRP